MKAILSLLLGGALVILFSLGLVSFTYPTKTLGDWVVPEKYKTMKNPYAGKADAEGTGKSLYKTHCASCHGKEGLGDGTKAAQLEEELRDFSGKDVQSQSDGVLYYKGIIGKGEMPNFEKKIPSEEDRWMLINFLRTLKK
jgi:mono/diheme cytochrome c family protein